MNEIQNAPFHVRAVKVNLPWMSYRKHECLQLHDETCRKLEYWHDLIDFFSRCKFNYLTLWGLHPWHYMVRSIDFPEACDLSDAELQNWQQLWRGIFNHAHARNMKVMIFFWNIFVSPAFARKHKVAEYSIEWDYFGEGDRSELVKRYNRSVLTQVLCEYPQLDGVGIAMSERMGGMIPEERGAWIEEVIFPAIRDAGRPVELNYRIPHSASTFSGGSTSQQSEMTGRRLLENADVPGPLWTEIKYNWSHGHSTPKLCIIHGGKPSDVLWNPVPEKYRINWMVRNEDFFCLRWCSPSFIREHLRINSTPWTGGYYVGSECYIPAKNYIDLPSLRHRTKWAFQRQRLFYLMWGSLLHDVNASDEKLANLINEAYRTNLGAELLPILDLAGQTPLRIATFYGATWDHTLYSEGFLTKDGFISINLLIEAKPLDPSWMAIREFVECAGKEFQVAEDRITPLQVAEDAERASTEVLRRTAPLDSFKNEEIQEEILDARAWAYLGLYFSGKLRAGVELQKYRCGINPVGKDAARKLLQQCVLYWDAIIDLTKSRFHEVPLQHTSSRPFSWAAYRESVLDDLKLLEQ